MATKPKFRTAWSDQIRFNVPTGNGIEDVYGYEIDKYGQKVLVKTGETNLYEKIQASLEETKIENILKRVAMGDDTVMRPDGIYADLTEAPKNLIEARQQMQKLENVWDKLPIDTKREYDFSVEKFIGASGSEKWLIDMGLLEKPKVSETLKNEKPKVSETLKNEQPKESEAKTE